MTAKLADRCGFVKLATATAPPTALKRVISSVCRGLDLPEFVGYSELVILRCEILFAIRRMRPNACRRFPAARPTPMRRTVQIAGNVGTLFGTLDENLKFLESALQITADLEDNNLRLEGKAEHVDRAARILEEYNELVREGRRFESGEVNSLLRLAAEEQGIPLRELLEPMGRGAQRPFGKKSITAKSANQRHYMDSIERNDMVFGIGPGGREKRTSRLRWPSPRC